jgi:MATE family multidrug resistance protein
MNQVSQKISHRTIWALAGPLIISNISVPLVGAVDTAVVGHLPGPQPIGAVALGALIFSFLYWGFGFLRMGTTGFIARARGAGDRMASSLTLLRVLLLALFFGALTVLLGKPLIALALYLLESSEQVESLAASYSIIRVWSAPATLCVYVFTGVFIGMHDTRRVMYLVLVLNLTNVALDLLFVPVLGLGVEGVAWATLIAEYTAAVTGAFILRKEIRDALLSCSLRRIVQGSEMIELMRANSHIFIRTLCLVFAFAWFTAQSARMGEAVLAANAILMHFQNMMAYAMDGFAHAAEALVGSAYGARNRTALRQAVVLSTQWAAAAALCLSTIYWAFGDNLLGLFSNNTPIIELAAQYLPWIVISPLLSVWSFQLDGIFIGTGHTREMRNAMLVSAVIYVVSLTLLIPWLDNHGLWLGLSGFMLIRAVTLGFYYRNIPASIAPSPATGPVQSPP